MLLVIYIVIGSESSADVCNLRFRVTYFADNVNNIERLLYVSDVQVCAKRGIRVSNNMKNYFITLLH